jgi:hypothetical protein
VNLAVEPLHSGISVHLISHPTRVQEPLVVPLAGPKITAGGGGGGARNGGCGQLAPWVMLGEVGLGEASSAVDYSTWRYLQPTYRIGKALEVVGAEFSQANNTTPRHPQRFFTLIIPTDDQLQLILLSLPTEVGRGEYFDSGSTVPLKKQNPKYPIPCLP